MSGKALGPQGGAASKAMRIAIGCVFLVLGLFAALIALLNLVQRGRHDQAMDALFVVQFVLYTAIGLAYLGIGLWNLVGFASTRKGPVVAALIMSAIGTLFGTFYVANLEGAPQLTQGAGVVLDIVVIALTGFLLRPKKRPIGGAASGAPRSHP